MRKDWAKIKSYYITHEEVSLRDIAKKYKVSESAVMEHSKAEGWVETKEKKRIEIAAEVEQRATEKIINRKVAANELHNELYDKGLKVAEMLLDMYMQELKNPDKRKKKLANAYNLDFIMKAISNAQKGQRLSLNIGVEDTPDSQPEVHIIKGLDEDKI